MIRAGRHEVEVKRVSQPVWVAADRTRLVQVLGNLIGNAAKYTPDGGRITVELRSREGRAELSVTDTGVGIAPEMLTRVFDMYVQLGDGASRTQGGLGLGLGLSLVRRLVEMHSGTVVARSPGPQAGSTFVVTLPLLMMPAPEQPDTPGVDAPTPASALRVLVIDDNADAADALCLCLQTMGHAACARYSGSTGLQAVQALQPDVVFCDIGLPEMDGREVAARLRRDPAHRDITLVALTGWGAVKDRELSSSAGFDAHLTKPASVEDICRALGLRP